MHIHIYIYVFTYNVIDVSLAAEAVKFSPAIEPAVAPALAGAEPAEEPTLNATLVCPEKLELGGGGGILLDSCERASRE